MLLLQTPPYCIIAPRAALILRSPCQMTYPAGGGLIVLNTHNGLNATLEGRQ
jgi:hypothetical protein